MKQLISQSLADQVYELVKREILKGNITGGEKIREDNLATQFGVSRTPIREALTRLAELAAMNTSTLYTYRYRASMPTIETLVEMCEVFEITLAEFFMVEDKNEELIRILNGLSDSSKELLMEVAKRMKE